MHASVGWRCSAAAASLQPPSLTARLSPPPLPQNKPDSNGSQFFLTLDRADHCHRQYTIFGKIAGEARAVQAGSTAGQRVQRWTCTAAEL